MPAAYGNESSDARCRWLAVELEQAIEQGIAIELLARRVHELEVALARCKQVNERLRAQLGKSQTMLERVH